MPRLEAFLELVVDAEAGDRVGHLAQDRGRETGVGASSDACRVVGPVKLRSARPRRHRPEARARTIRLDAVDDGPDEALALLRLHPAARRPCKVSASDPQPQNRERYAHFGQVERI